MYGLKLTEKSWNTKLDKTLKNIGFTRSEADPCTNSTIEGYSDADWDNEDTDRRSVTGIVFKFQGGPISWQS